MPLQLHLMIVQRGGVGPGGAVRFSQDRTPLPPMAWLSVEWVALFSSMIANTITTFLTFPLARGRLGLGPRAVKQRRPTTGGFAAFRASACRQTGVGFNSPSFVLEAGLWTGFEKRTGGGGIYVSHRSLTMGGGLPRGHLDCTGPPIANLKRLNAFLALKDFFFGAGSKLYFLHSDVGQNAIWAKKNSENLGTKC